MQSFFRELKRRNVYRVGAMYAVSGWLLVQVATSVLPIFDVGPGVLRAIVLLIAAGFPVALVLSWVYEITPEGIERTADVAPGTSITRHTGRRLDFVIIGVLALAVVFLVVQRYVLPQRAAPVAAPAAVAAAIPDKSIAVLPFENLSDEKASAYFATGIQDEILTRLAKIGALKVISRTSTAHYASNPPNLPEIAKQLGVANILEGSVQKAGDAVHINVQLIHAASDSHLWAEVYNRKLDDIFAVEAEVAGAIAEALNANLTGAEQTAVATRPTQNLAAYDAYLRGRSLQLAGYDYPTSLKAVAAFQEAVRLDPDFALAWAHLARVAGYLYFNGVAPETLTASLIKHATDTAVRLQPQLVEVKVARANYLYRVARDFPAAGRAFADALAESPTDHELLQFTGLVERRLGKWEQALVHLEQAAQLDPLNAGLATTLGGETYLNMHRYDEARIWLARALAIAPTDTLALGYQANSFQFQGRLEEAARLLDPFDVASIDPYLQVFRAQQRMLERRPQQAIGELEPVLARADPSLDGQRPMLTVLLGFAYRLAGDADNAKVAFEKAATLLAPNAARVDDASLPMLYGRVLAYLGRRDEALAQAKRANELYRDDGIFAPAAEYALAEVLALGGDRAGAIALLEANLDKPGGASPEQLRLDPCWDPLRGEARFVALTQRADHPVR